MRIYYHTWGNECILGSRIELKNLGDDIYTIEYEQEGFEPNKFSDIKIKYGNVVETKDTLDQITVGEGCHMMIRKIFIKFKAVSNPKPEKLFEIIEK